MDTKFLNKITCVIVFIALLLAIPGYSEMISVGEAKQYSGTVVLKEWTKSAQSYCQGGSEYYGLETETEEYVLGSARDPVNKQDEFAAFENIQKQLKKIVGQKVTTTAFNAATGLARSVAVGLPWRQPNACLVRVIRKRKARPRPVTVVYWIESKDMIPSKSPARSTCFRWCLSSVSR